MESPKGIRVADLSKFALALNSPSRARASSLSGGGASFRSTPFSPTTPTSAQPFANMSAAAPDTPSSKNNHGSSQTNLNSSGNINGSSNANANGSNQNGNASALNSIRPMTPSFAGVVTSARRAQHQELSRRLRASAFSSSASLARENASELSAIKAVEELEIDFSTALASKRGDLAILHGQTYRCFPRAPHLADIPLILKRRECMDRRIYDLKVYEADTFMRFQGHANVVSLYSYWSEPAPNAYTYKTLVTLEEEAIGGTLSQKLALQEIGSSAPSAGNATPSLSNVRSSASSLPKVVPKVGYRQSLKWCADLAKALIAFHSCNLIHARVRPSAILLDAHGSAMLGMMGRVELDAARQTHQLFSKVLIGQAIPQTLVYWAPELLKLEPYDTSIDVWALGVTMFVMCTRLFPFSTHDETSFREDVLSAALDLDLLQDYPRIQTVVDNVLLPNPRDRWTAHDILAYIQTHFAADIQRIWRGHVAKAAYKRDFAKVVRLQAWLRARLAQKRYIRMRADRRHESAVCIQSTYRMHVQNSQYVQTRSMIMKMQARVLARQCRESYMQYVRCVIVCQSVARRFIAQRWFDRVREGRAVLEAKLRTMASMTTKFRDEAAEYARLFDPPRLPAALGYLRCMEAYDRAAFLASTNASLHLSSGAHTSSGYGIALPELHDAEAKVAMLENRLRDLEAQLNDAQSSRVAQQQEDTRLRQTLGVKYSEFGPMVDALKRNLQRVAAQVERSEQLPLAIQHPYTYSKWDAVHEPYNVVENVLNDGDAVWKTVSPAVDLTLCRDLLCFVAAVTVESSDPAPATIEVYTSNVPDKWVLITTHKCEYPVSGSATSAAEKKWSQRFMLPGEPVCKYLRVVCKNNVRGGNIVAVRRVVVEGLVKDE
eukprot:ANDGO_04511.mRNA.1 Serine/threonine-protein kinase PAK mbt